MDIVTRQPPKFTHRGHEPIGAGQYPPGEPNLIASARRRRRRVGRSSPHDAILVVKTDAADGAGRRSARPRSIAHRSAEASASRRRPPARSARANGSEIAVNSAPIAPAMGTHDAVQPSAGHQPRRSVQAGASVTWRCIVSRARDRVFEDFSP